MGEHTALVEVTGEMERNYIRDDFVNISYLSQGRNENEILVTDSDAGTISFINLLTKEKTTVVGGTNRVGYITNMCDYGEWIFCLDNQSAQIWKYNKRTQSVELFAGNGQQQLASLGADKLESSFFYPVGIAVDNNGNIFLGEQHHILKIDATTGLVSLFAGAPDRDKYGYTGDGDIAINALFQSIRDLYYDQTNGTLYVADTYNDVIRKITEDGIISTLPVSNLNKPGNINVFDNKLYISNAWSNEIVTFDLSNNMQERFAGIHNQTRYQGSGHRVEEVGDKLKLYLNTPGGLDFINDKVFFCDTFNSRIMMIQGNIMKTIIGTMDVGYSSNSDKVLNFPTCVLVDENYLYVADASNYILRRYKLDKLF